MSKRQYGFSTLEGVLIVAVIGLLGAVGWLFWNNIANKTTPQNTTTESTSQESPAPSSTTTQTYISKPTQLTFDYPSDWKLEDDSDSYTFEFESEGNRGTQDHKRLTSPDGFILYFSSRSYGGMGGSGPCERTLTDFKNHGSSKLGASAVSYTINSNVGSVLFLYLTNNSSHTSAANNCLGYDGIIKIAEPKADSDGYYSSEPYAVEFGASALGRNNYNPEPPKPSDKDFEAALGILKSLRKA